MRDKPKVTTCTHTDCHKKECPNYSPRNLKGSYNFPDCMHNKENKK